MTATVDPKVIEDLKKYGGKETTACFNCGNCTAICSLSSEKIPFPRRAIRYMQLGLKEKLKECPEPWLCYYCGDCTETCPRNAHPGEVMMALRRYTTSLYDWTGISRLFYKSKVFEILSIIIIAGLIALGFYFFHGPIVTDKVALNVFAPNTTIELLDLGLLVLLSFFLLTNGYRLLKAMMRNPQEWPEVLSVPGGKEKAKDIKIPFGVYISEFKTLIYHFFTQRRFLDCESKTQKVQWFVHFLIMTGYAIVFLLVVVGIRWFQRDEILPIWNPFRFLGYYATFALLYGVTYAIIGRIKKSKTVYEFSHSTDWVFLIMLWLTTFSGILIHVARLLEWPLTTYYIYVIHLMIAVPMLLLEVPFAKWTHLLYRPLVQYLVKVRERVLKEYGILQK